MIHHSTFCTIASSERMTSRKGLAGSPTFSAAMPTTMEITRICRMLKLAAASIAPESVSSASTPRPRKFTGTIDCRKPSQEPSVPE